jgi:beta-glucosidase/6-phospho-beta-glucosidase/beta-galactosidase
MPGPGRKLAPLPWITDHQPWPEGDSLGNHQRGHGFVSRRLPLRGHHRRIPDRRLRGRGGSGVSIWDTFSHTPGRTRNGDTGDVASGHFLRLEEDLDLLAELAVDAYRFSVSWPRIQPTGTDGGPAVISAPLDFLGVNYYAPTVVAGAARAAGASAAGYCVPPEADPILSDLGVVRVSRPDFRRTAMGWEEEPAALIQLLARIRAEYPAIPVLITENGAAYSDYVGPDGAVHDPERVRYLDGHLRAVLASRASGVDVRGYFVWSLIDNFEWAQGHSKRFGLVWVDYPSGTRIRKDSFGWYRDTVRARALAPVTGSVASLA